MNIGIFGPSMAAWQGIEEFSYIHKLKEHFGANIIHTGCGMGSEERTLFDLKKIKKIDLAIIFHSKPEYMFIPSWNRDIRTIDRFGILKKIEHSLVKKMHGDKNYRVALNVRNTLRMLMGKDDAVVDTVKASDEAAIRDWFLNDLDQTKDNINSTIGMNYEEFIDAIVLCKKYMFHSDLQRSRYYGALLQIDMYLQNKKIPVVHCIGEQHWYPNWFEFKSGVVDKELWFVKKPPYQVPFVESNNGINAEGNQIIFNKLVHLSNTAIEKITKYS